jgi:hypothetical protein
MNHCLILMKNSCLTLKMNFRLILKKIRNYGKVYSCRLILRMNYVKECSFRSNATELANCFAEVQNKYLYGQVENWYYFVEPGKYRWIVCSMPAGYK